MPNGRGKAFTLIELLVVVGIILILVAISAPLMSAALRDVQRAHCASNLNQLNELLAMATPSAYPPGGTTPADWSPSILGKLDDPNSLTCPAADKDSPTNPAGQSWATCSYAYVGNLDPTYPCTHCGDGKRLWKLYWSGVDYTGGHKDGARDTDESTFSKANGYELSDNALFDASKAGAGEPADPTIPDHQDLGYFSGLRSPTERALRQVPGRRDDGRGRPLMMDIVVLTQKPAGAGSWRLAHTAITKADRAAGILFTNHCNTSAASKKDWGINVLYTTGSVQWKTWGELRFQVRAPHADGTTNHSYYY